MHPKPSSNVFGSFVIFVASCTLLAVQIWLEYGFYWFRTWEIEAIGITANLPVAIVPLVPAVISSVLLAAIVFSLVWRARLNWVWWYVCLPVIALATSELIHMSVPAVFV
jgi:hypothetical protein